MTNAVIPNTLPALINARINWEGEELLKSNQRLYEILAGCFSFYQKAVANQKYVNDIERLLKKRDISFQKTLPTENKLIKLVFGESDRRRVSAYAIVMRKAQEDAANAAADFAKWVKDKGGLEAIRTSGSSSSAPNYDAALEKMDKHSAISTIKPSSDYRIPTNPGYVMALARVEADRSVSLVRFVSEVNDARTKATVAKLIAAEEKLLAAAAAKKSQQPVSWEELEQELAVDLNDLDENPFTLIPVAAHQANAGNAA